MQHNAAFHLGLHCFLRLKQPSGTEIHNNLENSTFDPGYTVGINMFGENSSENKGEWYSPLIMLIMSRYFAYQLVSNNRKSLV